MGAAEVCARDGAGRFSDPAEFLGDAMGDLDHADGQKDALKRTGLYDLHLELGAKMVPFAGYQMPVQYPMGVLKEHLHTRAAAGLFDVSHMGQVTLTPASGDVGDAARALEALVPVDLLGLAPGRQRYAMFTNDAGGIEDDLMVANQGDHLFVVVNAARKGVDIAHMRANLGDSVKVTPITDHALLALQGPAAEAALARLIPEAAKMRFMDSVVNDGDFGPVRMSRSGYSGEDGFELSIAGSQAERFARALVAMDEVAPIGLGARDSLRLEAGLCPLWIGHRQRHVPDRSGSELGHPEGAPQRWGACRWLSRSRPHSGRTGQRRGPHPRRFASRGPRAHAGRVEIFAEGEGGAPIGHVTSGAYGPSIEAPMSMGYVGTPFSAPGKRLYGEVRGKRLPVTVTALPFRPATYKR